MQCIWPGGYEMKNKLIEVTFRGYQEKIDGTFLFLVNEVKSRSTVKYDKEKHVLVDKQKKGGD